MSPTALALIASAAIAHASWNFFAKQARGGLPFVWLAGVCATTLYALPAAIQLLVGSRSVSAAGIAFMFGSGCLHSAYFTTLQRGYAEGDLSVVYPLARGTGPALSVLAAVVILGERPGPLALVGAAIIVVAVISLAFAGHATPSRRAIAFALLTGTTIAAYTLWDAHAVEDLAQPTIAYYWGSEVTRAFVLAIPALRDREGLRTALAHDRRAILAVGALSPLAYILVLVALTLAPGGHRRARARGVDRHRLAAGHARARRGRDVEARGRRGGHPGRHRLPGRELSLAPWGDHAPLRLRHLRRPVPRRLRAARRTARSAPTSASTSPRTASAGRRFDELAQTHRNELREDAELTGVGTEPWLAIGQRALLVPHGERFVMWDCTTCFDDDAADEIERRGGLSAIAISHPHYYSGHGRLGGALRLPGARCTPTTSSGSRGPTRSSSCGRARRASSARG